MCIRDSNYKGYKINSVGPVSSGGICLIQMLNILENFNIDKYNIFFIKSPYKLSQTFVCEIINLTEYIIFNSVQEMIKL